MKKLILLAVLTLIAISANAQWQVGQQWSRDNYRIIYKGNSIYNVKVGRELSQDMVLKPIHEIWSDVSNYQVLDLQPVARGYNDVCWYVLLADEGAFYVSRNGYTRSCDVITRSGAFSPMFGSALGGWFSGISIGVGSNANGGKVISVGGQISTRNVSVGGQLFSVNLGGNKQQVVANNSSNSNANTDNGTSTRGAQKSITLDEFAQMSKANTNNGSSARTINMKNAKTDPNWTF